MTPKKKKGSLEIGVCLPLASYVILTVCLFTFLAVSSRVPVPVTLCVSFLVLVVTSNDFSRLIQGILIISTVYVFFFLE